MLRTVPTTPYDDQQPGTSGLRKRVHVFQQPRYLENFLQSLFDSAGLPAGSALVIGGDGRYWNPVALRVALRMAAANGIGRAIVGRGGILSTPAASHLIRIRGAAGGIILSASHNPGGPDGDFGVKFNVAHGGPAPDSLMEAVASRTRQLESYRISDDAPPDLDVEGIGAVGAMVVEVIDPVSDYAKLMGDLFDFEAIRRLFAGGFRMRFDAMHAVTGPYAREILERRLGAREGSVVNGTPLPDFGGGHPDPNLAQAHELVEAMWGEDGPDFGAASDGDGDRNMILGRRCFVTPSDSLAILTANATRVSAYADGLAGVARSFPTSRAVDVVAQSLGIPCFETPTGWKYFANLLEEGLVTLCGEESFGTGSNHVREKDGLWAVLFWLNLVAVTGQSVDEIVRQHWQRFGRHYYGRRDYEDLERNAALDVIADLQTACASLVGQPLGPDRIARAEALEYRDPVEGTSSGGHGILLEGERGVRVVFRVSGTSTSGATLRVYAERLETNIGRQHADVRAMLADCFADAVRHAGIESRTGRRAPSVET